MQDAEALVYKVLNNDATLVMQLGGKIPEKGWERVYNSQVAPNADEYPRITMFEVINDDAEPADDEPQYSDVNIRIDIWTQDEAGLFEICKRIKSDLKSAFSMCTIRLESKIYESDIQVYHKPINLYLLLEQESDS